MRSRVSEVIDLRQRLGRLFEEWRQPGEAELCALLREMLGNDVSAERAIHFERLKQEVYRLQIGGDPGQTLVLKRLKPAVAQTDRLVAERWLPALGLGDRCPRLLGAAAPRDGCSVWHVYEDLGHETLADHHEPWHLGAAVELLAELHTRGAVYPLLPEVRWCARDQGEHFFTANLRDAIATLDALATFRGEVPQEFPAARERLLDRLHGLLEDAPRRLQALQEFGGPDTLLHGDLW